MTDQIIIWDLEGKSQFLTLTHIGSLHNIAYSPDGKWLATASSEGNIYIWDVENNYALTDKDLRVNGDIYALAFSPDSKYIAAGSTNYFAYLWDVSLGQELSRIPHSDVVTGVEFSPDGLELVTAARKVVQFWDIPALPVVQKNTLVEAACSRLISNMSQLEWELFHPETQDYQSLCPELDISE